MQDNYPIMEKGHLHPYPRKENKNREWELGEKGSEDKKLIIA